MPSSIGWPELVVVGIIALIVFGPSKLPEAAAGLGKAIANFRRALRDAEEEIRRPADPGAHTAVSPAAAESIPMDQTASDAHAPEQLDPQL